MKWEVSRQGKYEHLRLNIPRSDKTLHVWNQSPDNWEISALGYYVPARPTREAAQQAAIEFAIQTLNDWITFLRNASWTNNYFW